MHRIEDFFKYLYELSDLLSMKGVHANILMFGGGALSMRYRAREQTNDLDVVFQEDKIGFLKDMVKQVGISNNIEPDWMNDKGIGSVTKEILEDSTVFIELPGLTLLTPSLEALLAMKICSMRIGEDFPDIDDIRFLLLKTGIASSDKVFEITEKYRSDYISYLTPKHEYIIKALLEESISESEKTTSFPV